jgi:hypothetical protein
MSYADLLHNGCNAATIYMTGTNPTTALTSNPFTFGRKDACHVDVKCGKKYALCGPSELLPGVELDVNQVSDWFTLRGMGVCSMMALMWTHTSVRSMGFACPLQRLICTASQTDADEFGSQNRYFNTNDALDYFDFFLDRGTHTPVDGRGSCIWKVDGNNVSWPMTQIDCTLGLSNVESVTGSSSDLTNVIKSFVHNSTEYSRYDILQCALNQLAGTGVNTTDNTNNACADVLPTECKANAEHMFGAVLSTLPSTNVPRTTVDPSCERFGYRRHRSRHLSSVPDKINDNPTKYLMNSHSNCLDTSYDMYLIIDGVHFSLLATPFTDNSCPPLMVHSVYDDMSLEMEKVMIVLSSDVESMNEDMSFPLGNQTLDNILEAFDTANVGYEKSDKYTTIYHPITNNCVALLQNMAMSMNIPLNNNAPLQDFIRNRMLSSLSSNSNEMDEIHDLFKVMIQEYETEGSNGTLHRWLSIPTSSMSTSSMKKEMVSKIMEYYLM